MSTRLSDKACVAVIKQLAKELNVEAKLIITRLMSDEDKDDMRNGDLSREALKLHIIVWKQAGYPDYRHGKTTPLAHEKQGQ